MTQPELSRPIDVRQSDGRQVSIEADENERAALAERFALVRIDSLNAEVTLARRDRIVEATGTMQAAWVQSCAVSAEDLPVAADQAIAFRFVPARENLAPDEELELDAEDCDEIEYEGMAFDLGEAVAQSLGLAIDPYATGPDADEARSLLREKADNPFARLKDLKLGE